MTQEQWERMIQGIIRDFRKAARLAGHNIPQRAIEYRPFLHAPHQRPTNLPQGKMAVYIFKHGDDILKVGKAGTSSSSRYTRDHYTGNVNGTLIKKLRSDDNFRRHFQITSDPAITRFIENRCDRVNLLIDGERGTALLSFFESFVQCRLNPIYEGSKKNWPL